MRARELIARYTGTGGSVYLQGFDLPPAELADRAVGVLDPTRGVQAGDLLLVAADSGVDLRHGLPPVDLAVGAHVALLLQGAVTRLPVARVLTALSDVGVQVVAATPLSTFPVPTTAVVGCRTDAFVVPDQSFADDLSFGSLSEHRRVARMLGAYVLDALVTPASERELASQLDEASAALDQATAKVRHLEPLAAELPGARADADRQRARIRQIETSETYRIARSLTRGVHRVRHPLGARNSGTKAKATDTA
jgi:hypothetical protein